MKTAAEQQIAAPRQRVWEALNDPEILRASIPGCQSLEKQSDDRFTAALEVKVGPIGARFKGAVSLTDLDPPSGYTLILDANGGIAGSAKGRAKVHLREHAGGTLIIYEIEAQVGGRMAQLGGSIIEATAKQLAGKFFARFGEIVGAEVKSTEPTRAAAASGVAMDTRATLASAALPAPLRLPMAWILAIVLAALVGFLLGRSQNAAASVWAGVAIGVLLVVVAGASFEYGRRAAAPVVKLDSALLRRLIEEAEK